MSLLCNALQVVKGFLDITGEYIEIILQLLQLLYVEDSTVQDIAQGIGVRF